MPLRCSSYLILYSNSSMIQCISKLNEWVIGYGWLLQTKQKKSTIESTFEFGGGAWHEHRIKVCLGDAHCVAALLQKWGRLVYTAIYT